MKNKLPFWGIDSCPSGWFCIGLGLNGEYGYFVASNIEYANRQIKKQGGEIALIDMPIGAPDGTIVRCCDKCARTFIAPRGSSVFPVLCREAIMAFREKNDDVKSAKKRAERKNKKETSKTLTPMGWGIVPKVVEVDTFMQSGNGKMWREVHPEVCFRALKGLALNRGSKKVSAAIAERCDILNNLQILPCNAAKIVATALDYPIIAKDDTGHPIAAEDDILDALAAAITAKLGFPNNYKTLPENPPKDSTGLPMEMVYVVP